MVRSRALSVYGTRWGSPLPNAPFLKGDGGAQAPTGDCLTQAAPCKACRSHDSAARPLRTVERQR